MSPTPPRRPRVSRQFFWVATGRVIAAAVQATTIVVLARFLRPEDFGLFAGVQGVILVSQAVFGFGTGTLVMRERARDRTSPMIAAALALNDRSAVALGIGVFSVLAVLGATTTPTFWLMLPLAVWAAAERNADVWLGVAISDGDARVNTFNLITRRLVALAGFGGLLLWNVVPPLLGYSIAAAIAALASWYFAHRFVARRLAPKRHTPTRDVMRSAWPYWLNTVATQARNLDAAIAGLVTTPMQTGFYAAAARLTGPLRILPTSLASVLLPAAARSSSHQLRRVAGLAAIAGALFALLSAIFALSMPYVVPALLGEEYVGAVPAIQVAVASLAFAGFASLFGAILQGAGLNKFVSSIAVAMTATCLGGVLVGGAMGGAVGATYGLALSYVVQASALGVRLVVFLVRREPIR